MKDELVTQEEFCRLLNEHVFSPNVGRDLTTRECEMLVHGMADVVTQLALEGHSVNFGRLGTFKVRVTPSGMCWNPAKRRRVKRPERKNLVFKSSKSTRQLLDLL